MSNFIVLVIGYITIGIFLILVIVTCCEFISAARWYYTRFNSNEVKDLEDVIYDANLRINKLKGKEVIG